MSFTFVAIAIMISETPGQPSIRLPECGVPQLFVDDALVSSKEGVVRTTHACAKLPQPVLEPEEPWEGGRVYVYGTVLRDAQQGLFRMWYMSAGTSREGASRDARLNHRPRDFVLYATSPDGLHWARPSLGLYESEGSKANNIVYDFHSPSVVFDASAEPERRYTMLGCGEANGKRGYLLAQSQDGIHWSECAGNPALAKGDTCTLARDPWTGDYLAFHKISHEFRGHPRRLVYLSTSKDLGKWSTPTLVMAPDEADDAQTTREGGQYSQFYNMSAFAYGSQFLGFVTHFRFMGPPPEKGPEQSRDDGPIDVQLVHSRDGRTWHRSEDRSPAIPNGPHAYDAGCILGVANLPVTVGDEVWFYYTAITTTHGGYTPKKRVTIARASWPLDRFVSLDAQGVGTFTTATFPCPGTRLLVNADASAGALTVAVLGEDGKVLSGYAVERCAPIRSDGLRHEVRWANAEHLPQGKPVRLLFQMEKARVFSFTIQ